MVDFSAYNTTEEELNNELSKTKIKLFLHKGAAFLASIMGQTEFVWSEHNSTAWTDGLVIGFNPGFWLNIPAETRITVLAHELWHIAYEHTIPDRIRHRDPKKWNEAADHVINLMLSDNGYTFSGVEDCFKDPFYRDMGTEEVYSLLPDPPEGSSSCNDPDEGSSSSSSPGSAGDPVRGIGSDVLPTPKDKQLDVTGKVVQAVQAAKMSNQAGDLPGEILLKVDNFLNPKLPWEILLRRFFVEQSNEDYSWKRPNRRYYDIYLPSLHSEDGLTKINYYLDVSGSVSDEDILRFNSEVKHIKEEFQPESLNLITFDTSIQDEYHFGPDDPFEKIIVNGRGGTDLRPVAKHIIENKPNVAVIFSDLWVEPMPSVGNIPVLWVVVGNPDATVPFGQMVHITSE